MSKKKESRLDKCHNAMHRYLIAPIGLFLFSSVVIAGYLKYGNPALLIAVSGWMTINMMQYVVATG